MKPWDPLENPIKDGFSIIEDGTKYWWLNHKLHREDGPAVESHNGIKQWWINDNEITELTSKLKEDHPKIYDQILIYQVMKS